MKIQFSIRDLLLIMVIAALAAGWWIDHQRINRLAVQQWEYRTGGESEMYGLGSQGWEMCGVGHHSSSTYDTFYFKRPK
jgi:hypothetical protein